MKIPYASRILVNLLVPSEISPDTFLLHIQVENRPGRMSGYLKKIIYMKIVIGF